MTIQVKLVQEAIYSLELWLINSQPLVHHHSYFLAATFDFTTFLPCCYFKRAVPFFIAQIFWYRCMFTVRHQGGRQLHVYTEGRACFNHSLGDYAKNFEAKILNQTGQLFRQKGNRNPIIYPSMLRLRTILWYIILLKHLSYHRKQQQSPVVCFFNEFRFLNF